MRTSRVGLMVAGSLAAGIIAAASLVAGPFAGAQEHVITGVVLLALAGGWALVAILSSRWSDQPQHWALLPAAFLGIAGGGLLLSAPGHSMLVALGWIWPPMFLAILGFALAGVRRRLHSRTRTWLVYPMFVAYALIALGGGYQAWCESADQLVATVPGSFVNVDGRRVYLLCEGSGSPTVVLEPGLGETSASWGLIAPDLARQTRVCTYDRAGRGGSESTSSPQDGVGVAADLHALLANADVAGPFVLVGHSTGAQYVRIFARRYPEQVAGMVLLDAQPAEALTRLPAYPAFYRVFRRVSAVLPSLARLGLGRMITNYASTRHFRSLRDEFAELPATLAQAAAFKTTRAWPLMVITAGRDAQPGWLPLQDELANLSSNSVHHILADATHAALVEDHVYAAASSRAIREVVESVRSGTTLRQRPR